jgi:hypothetical protein
MAKRTIKTNATSSLLTALEFIEPVMKDDGTPSQTHIILNQKFAFVFDGTTAIGHPIDEDLACCPQFNGLKAALKKSKDSVGISLKDYSTLAIASGKLKVNVSCIQYHMLMVTQPDAVQYAVNDTLKTGFDLLASIIDEKSDRIVVSSLSLNEGSMIATDGNLFLEFWHGHSLPTMILPKSVISIVSKVAQKLVGIGCTKGRSITFFFENGAWIKSLLRSEDWPSVKHITDTPLDGLGALPVGLVEAVEAVLPHSMEGAVYFSDGCVRSHHDDQGETGASYDVDGITPGPIYNGERLLKVLKLANQIQFDLNLRANYCCGFYGENIRGFLMSRSR